MPSTSNKGIHKSSYISADKSEIEDRERTAKKQEYSNRLDSIICNRDIKSAEKHGVLNEDTDQKDRTTHAPGGIVDVSVRKSASKDSAHVSIRTNCYRELFDMQIDKNLRMISAYLKRCAPEMPDCVNLYAATSNIHGIGVFAGKDILPGARIIEYVGELIGKKVADKRERFYKENGILSVYLFKIFDDLIVDATLKGNLARFINHSCSPNAAARIFSSRIFIYSTQEIKKDEEITFYYNFSTDGCDDRLPCYCGHDVCTKFMG